MGGIHGANLNLRWLSHVRTVLSSAWTVAFKAHTQRTPVLVHCSHGWDRTSQVGCAVAANFVSAPFLTAAGVERNQGHDIGQLLLLRLGAGSVACVQDRIPNLHCYLHVCVEEAIGCVPSR